MKKIYLLLSLLALSYGSEGQSGLLGNFEFGLIEGESVILCDGSDYNLAFSVTYTGPDLPIEGDVLYYWIPNVHYEEGDGVEAASSYSFFPGDEVGTFGESFNSEEVKTLFNPDDTTLNYGPYVEGQQYLSFIEFWDPTNDLYDIFFYEVTWCGDISTSVEEYKANRKELKLYPNPANQNLNIGFILDKVSEVTISLIDINGSVLQELMLGTLGSGSHNASVDIRDMPEGMYTLQLSTVDDITRGKLIIQK